MEISEHLDALHLQGVLMADAADRAGLDAPVPPCPPWLVKDLLRHTGYVQPGADGSGWLRVVTADTGDAWSIEARDGRLHSRRDTGDDEARDAGCTVRGPASGLYLYLWNRVDAPRSGVTVTGDPALLAAWRSSVRVRWG